MKRHAVLRIRAAQPASLRTRTRVDPLAPWPLAQRYATAVLLRECM